MSSLWTPGGERPVGRNSGQSQNPQSSGSGGATPPPPGDEASRQPSGFGTQDDPQISEEDAARMEQLQRQLAETPAETVVANHCFGLFELAALHLSQQPPKLGEAQLAIDAFAALVENLKGRLGEAEPHLSEGLSQLRLAFVQVRQGSGEADEEE